MYSNEEKGQERKDLIPKKTFRKTKIFRISFFFFYHNYFDERMQNELSIIFLDKGSDEAFVFLPCNRFEMCGYLFFFCQMKGQEIKVANLKLLNNKPNIPFGCKSGSLWPNGLYSFNATHGKQSIRFDSALCASIDIMLTNAIFK